MTLFKRPRRPLIELPPRPRGVRLHCDYLPEPVELPVRYAGIGPDGTHQWVARIPPEVMTEAEAFENLDDGRLRARFHLTIETIPGRSTVTVEMLGEQDEDR